MMDLKTFVNQPELDALELKKGADYVLSWKSMGVCNSKLKPLYTAFLNSIKLSEYRTKQLIGENCKCSHLDTWLRNPTNNFNFKNCLFGAASIVKNNDKEKYVYSGCCITFDSAGSWSFDNYVIYSSYNSRIFHYQCG